jgi:hypothetical protein
MDDNNDCNNSPGSRPCRGMNPSRHLYLVASMGRLVLPPVEVPKPITPTNWDHDHEHAWVPIQGRMAQYQCTLCKKIGRREMYGDRAGEIVLRKSRLPHEPKDVTFVSSTSLRHGHRRHGKGGPGSY